MQHLDLLLVLNYKQLMKFIDTYRVDMDYGVTLVFVTYHRLL